MIVAKFSFAAPIKMFIKLDLIRQAHLAVGMVREATVDAAVIYLGGSKSNKEKEKDEATHSQEEKVKRLVSIISRTLRTALDSGELLAQITNWCTVQMTM